MLRFREVLRASRGRAEKNDAAALIEQHRLVKHLEDLRARLVNRDEDDFVVRHPANDLDHVLGVFRRKTVVGSSKRKTSDEPIISRPMFSRLRSPPEGVFSRGCRRPHRAVHTEAELD